MKYLLALTLLSGCTAARQVTFLDSRDLRPDPGSAHVCIIQPEGGLDCISLKHFYELVDSKRKERTMDL